MRKYSLLFCFSAACVAPAPITGPIGNPGSSGPTASSGGIGAAEVIAAEACKEPSGTGTVHTGPIRSDETWTAAQSPHVIQADLQIFATVTVEACAVISVKENASIYVGGNQMNETGALKLVGSATEKKDASGQVVKDKNGEVEYEPLPVIVTAETETKYFGGIRVYPYGSLDMTVTAINRGGSNTQNGGGAIVVFGPNDGSVSKRIRANIVVVLASATYGINFSSGAAFTDDSQYLFVQGSGSDASPYAVVFGTPGVGTLPVGGTFTGNKKDAVLVDPRLNVSEDDGFRAVGIPYIIDGSLSVEPKVADGTPPKLTIDPGVTLKIRRSIIIGDSTDSTKYQATLVAKGTKELPITFTSLEDTPAKGDWASIWFKGATATGNAIENAIIEYAGGASGANSAGCGPKANDGAIFVSIVRPSEAFIKNTTFRKIAGPNVIISGWESNEVGPDLTVSNTFTDTAGAISGSGQDGCTQSLWRSLETNYCPIRTGLTPDWSCAVE